MGQIDVPQTRYAKAADGVHIAYQVFGEGPLDLVMIPGFVSHLELLWEQPALAAVVRRLGSFARVIAFDKRGTGLSDRTDKLPDLDQRMQDVRVVMDAAECERAAFLGISEGGPMAILFAATYPARTQALVLYGSYARLAASDDYPIGVAQDSFDRMAENFEAGWGTGQGLAGWAPSLADDPAARESWGRVQRMSASPGAALALITTYTQIDARPALQLVDTPTLVIHQRGDRMIPVALGRYLADHIPGARMVELPGDDHMFWVSEPEEVIDEVEEFLTGSILSASEPDRVMATVLFTDIVSSTERLQEVGDRRWATVLEAHDGLISRQVQRHGGRLVKSTGDGVLATFDGPARAIRCASAITGGAAALGLDVRAGLHAGEMLLREHDVSGIAVHLAQRVSALASGGEVLVSRTLVDLVAGSGLEFEDRGEHQLKGVEGPWRLFAVQA